jgi:hypothetical protein
MFTPDTRQRYALLGAMLILAVVFMQSGCKNDEPTAPSEPFLITRAEITRNLSPLPSLVLGKGQVTTFKYQVAYTLAPPDTGNNSIVFSGFYGFDANDAMPGGGFYSDSAKYVFTANTPRDLIPAANSGIDSVTVSFTIPANFVQLTLIAGPIDPTTRIFKASDTYSWIVQ